MKTINKFYMLVGIPGSGKSTLAQKYKNDNTIIHSSDALREELYGSEDNQDHNTELFNELHNRIKTDLNSGKNVIYDACNISSKRRTAFLKELKNIPCEKICIIAATPINICKRQNLSRERHVPEYVIDRMYQSWNTPYYFEGWDDIKIEYSKESYRNFNLTPSEWIMRMKDYKQDNPWHLETLGEHSQKYGDYIHDKDPNNILLQTSGYIHDLGKPYMKKFEDTKGNKTKYAHYYNHENVGAYECLFLNYESMNINPLDISIRVNLHSKLQNSSDKTNNKYLNLWGPDLYKDILLMTEADTYSAQRNEKYFESLESNKNHIIEQEEQER